MTTLFMYVYTYVYISYMIYQHHHRKILTSSDAHLKFHPISPPSVNLLTPSAHNLTQVTFQASDIEESRLLYDQSLANK